MPDPSEGKECEHPKTELLAYATHNGARIKIYLCGECKTLFEINFTRLEISVSPARATE